MLKSLNDFLRLESAAGVILVIAAVAAMVVANSPLYGLYTSFFDMPVEIRFGPLHMSPRSHCCCGSTTA